MKGTGEVAQTINIVKQSLPRQNLVKYAHSEENVNEQVAATASNYASSRRWEENGDLGIGFSFQAQD